MPKIEQLGPPQASTSVALDAANIVIAPESWPKTYGYNGDGTLAWCDATDGTSTWRKSYTWASGRLTGESPWVKQ
jgi:hypothetical protein